MKTPIIYLACKNILKNPRRSLFLALGNLFSIAFIVCVALGGISAMHGVEDSRFSTYGEHQYMVLNADQQFKQNIVGSEEIDTYGIFSVDGIYKNKKSLYDDNIAIGQADRTAIELGHLQVTDGRFPQKENEIAIEQAAIDRMELDLKVGDQLSIPVVLIGENEQTPMDFIITGILSNYSRVWEKYPQTSLEDNELPAILTAVAINEDPLQHIIYKSLSEKFDGSELMPLTQYRTVNSLAYPIELPDDVSNQFNSYILITILLIGTLLVVISNLGIITSVKISMDKRRKQMKTLASIGVSNFKISLAILLEIAIISGISLLIGSFLGLGLASILINIFSSFLNLAMQLHNVFLVLFSCFLLLIISELIAVFICILYYAHKSPKPPRINRLKWISKNRLLYRAVAYDRWSSVLVVLIMTVSIFISFPINVVVNSYIDVYATPLRADYMMYQQTKQASGVLEISESDHTGFTNHELAEIQSIQGVKNIEWFMSTDFAKIVAANQELSNEIDQYTKLKSGVSNKFTTIENPNIAVDLLKRDKEVYGYAQEEDIFHSSVSGLDSSNLEKLEPYVIQGKINPEKLASGEEIIAVQWTTETAADYPFQIGENIHLSELLLKTPSVNEFEQPHEAVRYDCYPEIGAIIALNKSDAFLTGADSYPFELVFLWDTNAFEAVAKPQSINAIYINFENDADMKPINEQLKQIVGLHPGTVCQSTYEQNLSRHQFETVAQTIGYGLSVTIALLGVFILYSTCAARIQSKKQNLNISYIIGADQQTIKKTLVVEGMSCGIISGICAILLSVWTAIFYNISLTWIPLWVMVPYAVVIAMLNYLIVFFTIKSKIEYSGLMTPT